MKKALFSILMLCYAAHLYAQEPIAPKHPNRYLMLAFEANRSLSGRENGTIPGRPLRISTADAYSYGMYAGLHTAGRRHFVNLLLGVTGLRHRVHVDYASSGLPIAGRAESGRMNYGMAIGPSCIAGYHRPLGRGCNLDVGAGISVTYYNFNSTGGGNSIDDVYFETNYRMDRIAPGVDGVVNVNFALGSAWLFAGLYARYVHGDVRGGYYITVAQGQEGGGFQFQRSFAGLNVGVYIR